jgi:hypothetical protein
MGVVALAAFVGALLAGQAGLGLQKFGGAEYLMRVVILSVARSLAPGVTGSALLVAFVVWAHPLPVSQLQAELPRFIKRGLLVTLPGYAVALAVGVAVGLLVAGLAFGVPWDAGRSALGSILPTDLAAGALSALADAGLIVFLAWRYLARLQAGRSSLPMKLVLAWTFGTGLRITLGLVVSLLLPAAPGI